MKAIVGYRRLVSTQFSEIRPELFCGRYAKVTVADCVGLFPTGDSGIGTCTMPLQIGAWTLNANGTLGQLTIDSVDTAGVLNGSLDLNGENRQIEGFWDEI